VELPPDVDDALRAHVERLDKGRPHVDPAARDRLAAAVAALRKLHIGRDEIALASTAPGGVAAKKVIGRVVRPQVDGVLAQLRAQQDAIATVARVLEEIVGALVQDLEGLVVQQLDDLHVLVAELRREVNALREANE
jgi:hypothetical protein